MPTATPIWVVFSSDGFILGAFHTQAEADAIMRVYDEAHPDNRSFSLPAMLYGEPPQSGAGK